MAESEELRPKKLRNVLGPRCWREGSLERKEVLGVYMSREEAVEGMHRAFSKCQLAYDSKGRKYRTNIPRLLPSEEWEGRQKLKKMEGKDGEVY
jgi:hypothetical protein